MSEVDPEKLRLVEALLFASSEPVPKRVIERHVGEDEDISALMSALKDAYRDRGVHLIKVGNAWAFRTAPDLGPKLELEKTVNRKLSRAAIETLAIIAYHQPITRAEIEQIRGVSISKGTLDVLFEETWIRPVGRRRTPGKPVTWGTSQEFLDHFGLEGLDDLPGMDELKAAGLLDSRPAIDAYGEHGDEEALPSLFGSSGDDVLPEEQDDEELMPEPLDPDDGAGVSEK